MAVENTLIVIKPDGMKNKQEILQIFYDNGFDVVAEKELQATREIAKDHLNYKPGYSDDLGSKILKLCAKNEINTEGTYIEGMNVSEVGICFEQFIINNLVADKVCAVILQGEDAYKKVKNLCGATIPSDAASDSIRAMFSEDTFLMLFNEKRGPYNVIHSAEDELEASAQIKIWFPEISPDEITYHAKSRVRDNILQ